MAAAPRRQRGRLAGLTVGLCGRHELYVSCLAALLESHGAEVRVLPDLEMEAGLDAPPSDFQLVLIESPLPSAVRRIVERGKPVVVLVDRAGPDDRLAGAALGASALLDKNASLGDLSRAIKQVLEEAPSVKSADQLTPRQREVLELVVQGLDNAQIATRLGIAPRTARQHVSGLLGRLGATNRTQAAVTAVRRGWIDPA